MCSFYPGRRWIVLVLLGFVTVMNPMVGMCTGIFECTNGNFKDSIGLYKGDPAGQCVVYVRYETGIDSKGCNGEAWTCYDDALNSGYAVGAEPKISAIVVFDKDSTKTGLEVGHVGIVVSRDGDNITIRDSNWVDDFTVGEHTININDYKIRGYIYCDGGVDSDLETRVTVRCAGSVCWSPQERVCEEADSWFDLQDIPYRKDASVCNEMHQQLETISQAPNPSTEVPEESFWQAWMRSFRSIFGLNAKAADIMNYTVVRQLTIVEENSASVVVSAGNGSSVADSTGVGYIMKPTTPPIVAKLPDFVVERLILSDAKGKQKYQFLDNESLAFHGYFRNIGQAHWAGTKNDLTVRFYLSRGYKEDAHDEWRRIGTAQIKKGNLNVGPTKHEWGRINLSDFDLEPGVYNIVACADREADQDNGRGRVPEKHESNNCSTEAVFQVTSSFVPVPDGDASVTLMQVSLEDHEDWHDHLVVRPNTKIDLQVVVTEATGVGKVADATLKYYVSGNGELVFDENPNRYLASDTGVNIDPGQQLTEHKRHIVTPSEPGIYAYYTKAISANDPNQSNNISDPNNAGSYVLVTVVATGIKGTSLSFSPLSDIHPGDLLRVQSWWNYSGPGVDRDVRVAYFANGNLLGTGVMHHENLTDGVTKYEDFYFAAPGPGTYTLLVQADPDGFIPGDNIADNWLSTTFVVQDLPPAPMVIWILNPTPGETWKSDKEHYIKWRTQSLGSEEHFVIDFSLNDGASWTQITSDAGNDGSKRWVMRDFSNIKSDTDCARIRIISVEHPWVSAMSEPFKIDYKKKK